MWQDVFRLWDGDISDEEQAFRCLSIIDFIVDWARDIYRPNVIQQLKSMTKKPYRLNASRLPSPSPSVQSWCTNDSDEGDASDASVSKIATAINPLSEHIDRLRQLSNDQHAYRDARFIRSRIMGLFVTEDTLQELANSRENANTATAFIGRIALQLEKHAKKDALFEMNGSTIADIEKTWVGEVCGKTPHPTQQFLVSLTISAYMSPTWEPTRELAYIAVARNVISTIRQYRSRSTRLFTYPLARESALALLREYRKTSIVANLSLCLQRCSIIATATEPMGQPQAVNVLAGYKALDPLWMIEDVDCKPRNFVWNIFRAHHKKEGESFSKCYLRLGAALQEHRPARGQPHNGTNFFPELKLTTRMPLVLAFHGNDKASNWCVFWLNEDPAENLPRVGNLEAATPKIFYTTQRHGPSTPWNRIKWNENCPKIYLVDNDAEAEDCLQRFCVSVQRELDIDSMVATMAQVRLAPDSIALRTRLSLVS
ncbi:hypothetical protein NQ176_g5487 [Zarea fungicola]|uniref:Uncharacterized protein n=1 Tax=Zarea fungicola TaxID=93591 RepID=A0ACC1NA56_9HYPO|nr:hypothetical protein NQ176_g5487 [Lecanicillium fungicola]